MCVHTCMGVHVWGVRLMQAHACPHPLMHHINHGQEINN